MARGRRRQQEESGGFTGPPDFGAGLGELMAMLGIGPKGALEQRRLDLDELQALAQAEHYTGDIREKAAARELAGEEMRSRQQEALENAKARAAAAEAAGRTEEFQREMKRVATDEATAARQLNEAKLIADLPDTVMSPVEKREYYKTLGKAGESMLRVEEGKQRTETKGFRKGLETAYKTGKPEAVKEYLKGRETAAEALPEGAERLEAMMRDPSIDWQALNAGMPAPQPGIMERLPLPNIDLGSIKQVLGSAVMNQLRPYQALGGLVSGGGGDVALPETTMPQGDYVPEWQGGAVPPPAAVGPIAPPPMPNLGYGERPAPVLPEWLPPPPEARPIGPVMPETPGYGQPVPSAPYQYGVGANVSPELPETQQLMGEAFRRYMEELGRVGMPPIGSAGPTFNY